MCEFKVTLDGKVVFEDVIYARDEGGKVVLKSVLGASKEIENCAIIEVDVSSERLALASISR